MAIKMLPSRRTPNNKMNSSKFRSTLVAVTLLGYLATSTTPAHAGLTGETIDASGPTLGPPSATIGPGVEFIGIADFMNFDFGDNTLTLTIAGYSDASWGDFKFYTFSGFTDTITGLSIGTNDGFSGDVLTDYTFTDHSITLHMGTGAALNNPSLVFDIDTAGNSVPDQSSTVALCGIALAGIGSIRRRR
jgi:VPDSG-CTERM motif